MHVAIDLRFYRPQPFGLSVHIRELMLPLVELLISNQTFTKVTLVLDSSNRGLDLQSHLSWWKTVTSHPKFSIFYSRSPYYSVQEQTWFNLELFKIRPDLVYFFTFNHPILYPGRFVYGILDMTLAKNPTSLKAKLKAWIMLKIMNLGALRAREVIFLGPQTKQEAEDFGVGVFFDSTKPNFRSNHIVFNGVSSRYLQQSSADEEKSATLGLLFDAAQKNQLLQIKQKLSVHKPYFLFVSVWKPHKNIGRMIEAFEKFHQKYPDYQLVIAGRMDPKNPQILEQIQTSYLYKQGVIVVAQNLNDGQIICLQDGAFAYIMPSLSEGFGLTLVEAAVRGTPVLCSDIPIFKEIMGNGTLYFNPLDSFDIYQVMEKFYSFDEKASQNLVQKAYAISSRFRWDVTARQTLKILEQAVS